MQLCEADRNVLQSSMLKNGSPDGLDAICKTFKMGGYRSLAQVKAEVLYVGTDVMMRPPKPNPELARQRVKDKLDEFCIALSRDDVPGRDSIEGDASDDSENEDDSGDDEQDHNSKQQDKPQDKQLQATAMKPSASLVAAVKLKAEQLVVLNATAHMRNTIGNTPNTPQQQVKLANQDHKSKASARNSETAAPTSTGPTKVMMTTCSASAMQTEKNAVPLKAKMCRSTQTDRHEAQVPIKELKKSL